MSKDSMVRSHTRNIFGVDDERDKMQEQISRLSIINDAMNGGSTDGEEDGSIVTIIVDFKDELRGVANLAKHNSSVMEVKHEIVSNLSTSLGVSISERTSGTDENIFGRGIYALDNSFGIVTRLSGKDAVKEITEKI